MSDLERICAYVIATVQLNATFIIGMQFHGGNLQKAESYGIHSISMLRPMNPWATGLVLYLIWDQCAPGEWGPNVLVQKRSRATSLCCRWIIWTEPCLAVYKANDTICFCHDLFICVTVCEKCHQSGKNAGKHHILKRQIKV